MNQPTTPKRINWKYALGEIIIVIIGISIAFSLNRWAENAKDRQTKRQYLESLLVDLDSEMSHLEGNIQAFEQKLKEISHLMPYLYGRQEGRDSMFQKVFRLAEIIHFQPKDVTYKTLINSGDLGIFQDFDLKKQMEDFYSSHESIQLDYQRQHHINEKYFADFIIYEIDYTKIRQGDYSFMDVKLLKNIVQSLYGTYNIAIVSSKEGIERCQKIKGLIEQHLQKI